MDVSDIPGAKPKSHYPARRALGEIGHNIVDPTKMTAAGGLKKGGQDSGNFMSMGAQYERVLSKNDRNAMDTSDINGIKKNQFGAKMHMPD